MKSSCILCVVIVLHSFSLKAQEYSISTQQTDSFSVALVKLLQCASSKFDDCKGEFLQYTMMQENEYRLNFPFPGSAAAIIRHRDWDKNAYVEFRGYSDKKKLQKGVNTLIKKIKTALGNRWHIRSKAPHQDISLFIQSISISDSKGFFQPNMELFTGSSASTYLLQKNNIDTGNRKEYFILLKIYGGIPSYNYFISPHILPPDKQLHTTLQQLLKMAETDFDETNQMKNNLPGKKKKMDTLHINNNIVIINRRGGHYSANIYLEQPADSLARIAHWEQVQKMIQAAVGNNYFYIKSNLSDQPFISYIHNKYDIRNPVVYLQTVNEIKDEKLTRIEIRSNHSHPTKRSASMNEDDWK